MGAIDDIAAERRRQIEVEGWTPEHDDKHTHGDLAIAAACYAAGSTVFDGSTGEPPPPWYTLPPAMWPWTGDWWKPKGRRQDLVRAGALIVAEIERLDRAKGAK